MEVFIQLIKMNIIDITGSLCIRRTVKIKLHFNGLRKEK